MEMAQNHEPPKQMIIIVNGRRFLQQLNLANASYICFFFSFPAWKKTSKTSSSQSDCSTSWGLNFWKILLQPRWEVQDIGCNWLYVGENNPRIWGHINNL